MDPETDKHLAKQARLVALVVAGTMLAWIGAQFIGRQIGLEARYAFLFDLAALAAFTWSLIVIFRIWRARRDS